MWPVKNAIVRSRNRPNEDPDTQVSHQCTDGSLTCNWMYFGKSYEIMENGKKIRPSAEAKNIWSQEKACVWRVCLLKFQTYSHSDIFGGFPLDAQKKKLGKSCGADCGQNVYRICPLVYGKAQLEKGKIKRKTTYGICMWITRKYTTVAQLKKGRIMTSIHTK